MSLIVSAAKFEREEAEKLLKSRKVRFHSLSCGIGAINAAKNAATLAKECQNEDVIFLGSCGSFDKFTHPYLVTAKKVVWAPAAEKQGLAYGIDGLSPEIAVVNKAALVQSLPEKIIVCGPSVSLKSFPVMPYQKAELVENLELYSCVDEIQNNCRSLAIVLCVTNALGADAHAQWKANLPEANRLINDFLTKELFR